MKVYAVIYNDCWDIDYITEQVCLTRAIAERIKAELDKALWQRWDKEKYYHVIKEFEIVRE